MRTAVDAEPRIREIEVTDRAIVAHLVDGRVVSVPLEWSWRLSEATPAARMNFRRADDGSYVHWPDVDEDLSAQGRLTGMPAPQPGSRSDPSTSRERVRVAKKNASVPPRRSARG